MSSDCLYCLRALIKDIISILTEVIEIVVIGYVPMIAHLPGTAAVNTSNDAAVSGW